MGHLSNKLHKQVNNMKAQRIIAKIFGLRVAVGTLIGLSLLSPSAQARLYDNFTSGANWTLADNGGTAAIAASVLTLTAPADVTSKPTATLISSEPQNIVNSRQSILIRSHTGVVSNTAFFYWAVDNASANLLELKIDDVSPRMLVAGYYSNGGLDYHWVSSTPYPAGGGDGLYIAIFETNGVTYWQYSPDTVNWTNVASMTDPISMTDITFEMQHKAYGVTSSSTATVVDCFNYLATGAGYLSLEDKDYTSSEAQPDGWQLYTECFSNNILLYTDNTNYIQVNNVDSTQHFTDTSIPEPRANDMGYDYKITRTAEYANRWLYCNAYRYQYLPYIDAETWTYHLYFKYAYPQYIVQGLEFPLNKYTGSQRLEGAVAWYPERPATTNLLGKWSVWGGADGWVSTGLTQAFDTNWWYEVTFTVGLHDGNVYYSGFSAGAVGAMSNFTWNVTYTNQASGSAAGIVPAMQMDDNTQDTTEAGTEKDCYMAEWNITWQDQKLP
jgi:hypothetical protein